MKCPHCGNEYLEGAKFCNSCGASLETPQQVNTPPTQPAQPVQPVQPTALVQPARQTVSVGTWICRWLINLIPCVGWLVYLIMLFVWACDKKYDETSSNWAKAQLIIYAVCLILGIILAVIFGTSISNFFKGARNVSPYSF